MIQRRRRKIAGAAEKHAASGLIDGGVTIDDVDPDDGDKIVSKIFGGNNSEVGGFGLVRRRRDGSVGLVQKLLPMLAPDRARLHRQAVRQPERPAAGERKPGRRLRWWRTRRRAGQHPGRRHGGGGGSNPLGSILGSVLGGGKGGGSNPIGEILGGLLGGKR